jgi:PAS domain-containing protein
MSAHMRDISGEHLAAAARAVSVALVVEMPADEVHAIRKMLPPHGEMVRVLDVLGWPGSPETAIGLAADDQETLATIVYATVILALEETQRTTYQTLRSPGGLLDTSPMLALESLARLAIWLNDVGPIPDERLDATSRVFTGEDGTPPFSALAASVALPVWVTDSEFRVDWVNPALLEILGPSRDDPLPTADEFVARLVHPDDRVALHAVVDAPVRSGTAFATAFRMRRPDGTRSEIDLCAEFDHDAHDTPVTIRGTLHATPSPPDG